MPSFAEQAHQIVADDLDQIAARVAPALQAGGRVLLTGGAGFLGYYLVQTLLRLPAARPDCPLALTVLDTFQRGAPQWLQTLADSEQLTLLAHDVTQPLPPALTAAPFDYILHAASIASPTFYRQFPLQTMDANVNGLRALLDLALRQQQAGHAPRGFLFFSSSEIYGDPSRDAIPTPEHYRGFVSCTGPRACYDESKRYGETLCVTFAAVYGLPVVTVRPFNNYGPGLRLDDRRLLPDLARDALAGKDLVLHSDGTPTRTFCYVADAVTGYLLALLRGRPGEAYNIGTEAPEVSVRELAERVAAATHTLFGYQGRVIFQPSSDAAYLTDNPQRRCPDIRKAREELGFDPQVTLDEGLRRSLIWYAGQDR